MKFAERCALLAATLAISIAVPAQAAFQLEYVEEVTPRDGIAAPALPAQPVQPGRMAVQDRAAPRSAIPTAAPVAPSLTGIRAEIARWWPGDDAKVLCLVDEESDFNPNARNGIYLGLFQMDGDFRATYGYGPSVKEQTLAAWRGFQARGWQPWPPAARC